MANVLRLVSKIILALTFLASQACAQPTGQFPPNSVYGNSGSVTAPPKPIQGVPFVVNVTAYGCVADSVPGNPGTVNTDNAACIAAAVNALPASGGTVFFPKAATAGKCYGIKSTISLGNGTTTTESTVHGIRLVGETAGGVGPSVSGGVGISGASCLEWGGVASGDMLQILGPITGVAIKDINFDGNASAATAVRLIHAAFSEFRFNVTNWTGVAIQMNTVTGATGFAYGACNNSFYDVQLSSPSGTTASGISLDGNVTTNLDSCSNRFYGLLAQYGGGGGSFGVSLTFADSNEFIAPEFFNNTVGAGFDVVFTQAGAPRQGFPTGNHFIGVHGGLGCTGTAGTGGKNFFISDKPDSATVECNIVGTTTWSSDNKIYADPQAPWTFEPTTFASLANPVTGSIATISDGKASNCGDTTCTTWGTTVTGGTGALNLFIWYNGTNWTLIGK